MTKICPNCKNEFDDNQLFCSQCGSKLVDKSATPNPVLYLGDANAISGGVHVDQSKNITSNDVHYHTIQERSKTVQEVEQEKRNQYREAVSKWMRNGAVTIEARVRLDDLRVSLGVDPEVAKQIELAVKNEQTVKTSGDTLTVLGKIALKNAVTAVEGNSPQAATLVKSLASACKNTTNEQLHYYYHLLMAAFEPQQCIDAYEHRMADAYWQSFWASLAYRKQGKEVEAEAILNEMPALWPERPETDVLVNACVGMILSSQGDLDECRDTIVEYLNQATDEPSELLDDLFHALLHEVGMEETDNGRHAFYVEQFLSMSEDPTEELKEAEEAFKNDKEGLAWFIWLKWAERGNAAAQWDLGNAYANGDVSFVAGDMAECARWWLKAEAAGWNISNDNQSVLGKCFEVGRGVVRDYAEAQRRYQLAVEQKSEYGKKCAQEALENLKSKRNDPTEKRMYEEDMEKAREADKREDYDYDFVNLVSKWVKQGDPLAQYYFGLWLEKHNDDYEEAFKHYEESAWGGNADAQFQVGLNYENGWGTEENKEDAAKWYWRAAEQGRAEALEWCLKEAEKGNPVVQFYLASMYYFGRGVEKNKATAQKWFEKSANQGYESAKRILEMAF